MPMLKSNGENNDVPNAVCPKRRGVIEKILASHLSRYLSISIAIIFGWIFIYQRSNWSISTGIGATLLSVLVGLFGLFRTASDSGAEDGAEDAGGGLVGELNWLVFETRNRWFYVFYLFIVLGFSIGSYRYATIIIEGGSDQIATISVEVSENDGDAKQPLTLFPGSELKIRVKAGRDVKIHPSGLPALKPKFKGWEIKRIRLPQDFLNAKPTVLVRPVLEFFDDIQKGENGAFRGQGLFLEILICKPKLNQGVKQTQSPWNVASCKRSEITLVDYRGEAVLIGGGNDVKVPDFLLERWSRQSILLSENAAASDERGQKSLLALHAIETFENQLINRTLPDDADLEIGQLIIARLFVVEKADCSDCSDGEYQVLKVPELILLPRDVSFDVCNGEYEDILKKNLPIRLMSGRRNYEACGLVQIRASRQYPIELKFSRHGEHWRQYLEWRP